MSFVIILLPVFYMSKHISTILFSEFKKLLEKLTFKLIEFGKSSTADVIKIFNPIRVGHISLCLKIS